ncbi:MAG: FIST N-terminal domain-containing protein [Limisphaerales bacterium]
MNTDHSVVAHWHGAFEEAAFQSWAKALRAKLKAPKVSLGRVFMAPKFFPHARETLEVLRVHAQIPLLLGCSSQGLIANAMEIEEDAGLVLGLYHLPGADLTPVRFTQAQVEECNRPTYWHGQTGVGADSGHGWLALADPFSLDAEKWLKQWTDAYAPQPILGGLASGDFAERATQLYLNGDVFEDGGVALAVGGGVRLQGVISQGCTPIGETWTITQAERNIIAQIGNRPAYQRLVETFEQLPASKQQKARGNLFVGLVINEYLEEFHRGDFLIRNLIGADPASGALAVGALPRLGQTLQFQRRDAQAATEDMAEMLARAKGGLPDGSVLGGVLCCCNGRGHRRFGEPSHDARMVQDRLGPLGLTGFFCNGELGPVGERNFLHGYTASLALFVRK